MALISDILLASGAFAAAIYCYVLARRLSRFTKLESGMGGAIAVLSAQVDDMTKALEKARTAAGTSSESLEGLTRRAEQVAGRIELLLASLHDLPDPAAAPRATPRPTATPAEPPAADDAEAEAGRKLRFVRRRAQRPVEDDTSEPVPEAAE